jgi:parvulin-like peptidyl-prolyl isomerase
MVPPAMKLFELLREPLVHFLAAGGLLFVAASAFDTSDREGRNIRISRESLLTFMQGRAQVYDENTFQGLLDAMKPEDRARLLREAALQEALYREGETLGLAQADPLIRQRVVQQMRLLLMEEAAAGMTISDAEVKSFYGRNRGNYALPPSVTFTHVYFPGSESRRRSDKALKTLRRQAVPFDRSGEYGERFLYQLNYVDSGPAVITSHFGKPFADQVLAIPSGSWQGPIASEHGWHLVLVSDRAGGRAPAFSDIASIVREDALAEKRQKAADAALDRMLRRYSVTATNGLAG